MSTEPKIGIGSTLWVFEGNHRVYPKSGRGGPIYREHFRPIVIYAETSRSWLLGYEQDPIRVDKKTLTTRAGLGRGGQVLASERDVDDACFVEDERHKIADKVRQCRDATVLRQIAALLRPIGTEELSR